MDDLTPATAGAGRASTKRAARRGAPAYNDNTLVVGYYRYSSASQNEASIEQQRELVHRWPRPKGSKWCGSTPTRPRPAPTPTVPSSS